MLLCKLSTSYGLTKTNQLRLQILRIGASMYGAIIFLIHLAILLQYLRIFVPLRKRDVLVLSRSDMVEFHFLLHFHFFADLFLYASAKILEPMD